MRRDPQKLASHSGGKPPCRRSCIRWGSRRRSSGAPSAGAGEPSSSAYRLRSWAGGSCQCSELLLELARWLAALVMR